MSQGQYVFSQIMDHLPLTTFRRCVDRYDGERKIKSFSCLDQFRCFAFAQLTWRESLRDIEACLRTQSSKLYRLGFRCPRISRNTMANANAVRDWRIYADFAQHLIAMARELYTDAAVSGLEELDTVYALDFIDNRSVPVGVPMGAVPLDQGRRQTAHLARPARLHPFVHLHQRRQDA